MKSNLIKTKSWTTNQVVFATLFVVCVFLSFWLLYRFRVVVFLFFIAFVIGTTMRPMVEWLYQRGLSRPAGIILIYMLFASFLIGFIALVVPLIVDQATQLYQNLPTYQLDFRKFFLGSSNLLFRNIGRHLPVKFIFLESNDQTTKEVIDKVNQTFHYANLILRVILSVLAVFLLAYYWTQESNFVIRNLLSLIPRSHRKSVRGFVHTMEAKIGGYVRGQGILSLVVGLAALIAYALIGLPYTLILAIIAGIMEMVPIFGPALGAIPALLVALSVDPKMAIWVVISTAIIQLVENVWLVPRIMKDSMGVNPILILLSLIAFSSVFGFPGALLALPLAAVIQLIFESTLSTAHETEEHFQTDWSDVQILLKQNKAITQALKDACQEENAYLGKSTEPILTEIISISKELNILLGNLKNKKEL